MEPHSEPHCIVSIERTTFRCVYLQISHGANIYTLHIYSCITLFANDVFFIVDSFGETQGLGMIVFIAIMLHKAPASMGFGTFLQHHGCQAKDHAKHLLAFTLSSPLMNLIVFFGLCASQSKATDLGTLQFWVGILMLISAGSFLYVATIHILPEVYAMEHAHGASPAE